MKHFITIVFCVIAFAQNIFSQTIDPQKIQIARDRWGVPHIFAKTDPEVAYGLAYAQAEDDFKTMQMTLLAGKQMLGVHLGKGGAAIDYVGQLIRARRITEEKFDSDLSPEYKALLNGYTQGLNAYARKHPSEVLVKDAFPITPKDVITSSIISISVFSGLERTLREILGNRMPLADFGKAEGSNAFAFNSAKTTDGKAYLNINSHQPLEGPQSWYEAHLVSEEGWNCMGGLFPGGTSIFLGTNENLGWSHTVNYHDKMDVYQLQMNPQNPKQYLFDGKWIDLEEEEIKLRVKVGLLKINVKRKIWWSKYGPTVVTDKGPVFAMRFAALFDIRSLEQWYKMNKARNFSEFKKTLEMTAIPGFNVIYADRNDTIYYLTNGKIPRRDPAYDWQKTLPGHTSKTLWTEFHPLADLPQVLQPKSGYVYNTNNTPYSSSAEADNPKPENYDPTMGIERWELNRSVRFQELIKNYERVSYDDFKKMKYDLQLPQKLAYITDANEVFRMKPDDFPEIRSLLYKLQKWDRRANIENPDAAIFLMFYHFVKQKTDTEHLPLTRVISVTECVDALKKTKEYLLKHFSTIEITLGEIQKLRHGKVEVPMPGIPDVLAAMASVPQKDGRFKATSGESYIMLVKYAKTGLPEIETVMPYGASNKANKPHYTDQMEMFATQKTKKMTLDKAEILRQAERVYTPTE
jgi:acyl-homoserine-lactone acylase